MKKFLEDLVFNMGVQPFCDENGDSSVLDLINTIDYNFSHGYNPENDNNLSAEEKEFALALKSKVESLIS